MPGGAVGHGNQFDRGVEFLAVPGQQSAGMVFGVIRVGPEKQDAWRYGHFGLRWFSLAAC